jgi:hypothetical protein
MYLYATKYAADVEWSRDEERQVFRDIVKAANAEKYVYSELPTLTIDLKVGYWRKANQIHQWFVDNVQDGTDNCAEYYVSREKLQELRDLCAQVKGNKETADDMLPPASGFFFGSLEIDEWYWQDIDTTIETIDTCLQMPDEWSFKYQSSW